MKKLVCSLLLVVLGFAAYAQEVYSSTGKPLDETDKKKEEEKEKGFNLNNLIFGGGFIFGIGGGITNLGISPVIGYKVSDHFSAGIGLGYEYLGIKNYTSYWDKNGTPVAYDLKTSIFSGSVWARYLLFQNVFVHVEPQMIYWTKVNSVSFDPVSNSVLENKQRLFVPRMLVGGGIRQPISDRVSGLLLVLYDVIRDPNSPYNGLDIRFGIVAGF